MKRGAFTLAGLMLAGTALAQDLPPGVLLLSRVKNHLKDEFGRLQAVSCVETVGREVREPKGKMRPLDTVRLEVLTNGSRELFSSPGGRQFSPEPPISYVGSGLLGDGLFGPYLKTVVLSGAASTSYQGEEEKGGRPLARYDYQLAVMFSGLTIHIPEGSGRVGLHGSYWVDPRNYDVVRLDLEADNFPPTLPVTEANTSIDYARTRLGDEVVLLPQTADVRLVKESGEVSHNQVEFTQCHVFGAESTVSFAAPDSAAQAPGFGAAVLDDTLRPLPGGLQIAVKLASRISSDTAVGTLVDGVVAGDVREKRAVVIPQGAPVRGRIRRLERYTTPFPYFVVGLEFTEVQVQGVRHLFYADLLDIDAPGVERSLSTGGDLQTPRGQMPAGTTALTVTRERISTHELPGVATFFFRGGRLDLPRDFRTVWKTRPLKR
ncbi:MAG TPA: hypothetical protein VJ732_08820 [Bryobacteraceae bacterium]|nr:hypothetical protein [Bryobacteraceae bacterium]